MNTREILSHIPDLRHLDSGMFLLMAGPCVVENETMLRQVAETACRITERLRIPYIFKASYRKANRSAASAIWRRCACWARSEKNSAYR